jgi:inner membrane protein
MDTLTHALSGALLACATARGKVSPGAVSRPRRMAVGALAAAFPDSDFVLSFISPLGYLLNHRGITHSIVMLPAWAWLLAVLAALAYRDPRGWRAYWAIAAMGIGVHILGDLVTSYGTMIWAPFSDARYAWGTTFIIDLWFSGIILAGLLLSIAQRASRMPAIASLAVLVAYVGLQGWLKSQAIDVGLRHAAQQMPGASVSVQPGPVSPFNWMVIDELDGEYRYALVSLLRREPAPRPTPDSGFFYRLSAEFDPPRAALWRTASLRGAGPDAGLAREAWARPELAFFKWFAQYPALYRVDRGNPSTCAWFYDLRFFRPGTDFLPFRYGLCRDGDGPWRRFQLIGDGQRAPLN